MRSKESVRLFVSGTHADFERIAPLLQRLRGDGWQLGSGKSLARRAELPELPIEDCDLLLAFVSGDYLPRRETFVSELSYAGCALGKPYLLIALEALGAPAELPPDLGMLAAKNGFTTPDRLAEALAGWLAAPVPEAKTVHTERRYAFKPFEASEERYAFISYAHDDAYQVYPILRELYETGWNLWYDEGIRITERYLPEISRHVRECEVFLLFVTPCALGRPFVIDFELAYALRLGKRIIPVLVEPVERLPEGIAGLERAAPDESLQRALAATGLSNHGRREAVPPKDKKDEEYDLTQLGPLQDYEYRLSGDGLFLTRYTGQQTEVMVPGRHCGLPVRGLEGTFHNCRKLQTVVCPESVTEVKAKTFHNCFALRSVTYRNPACRVDKYAFAPRFDGEELTTINGYFWLLGLLAGIALMIYAVHAPPRFAMPFWTEILVKVIGAPIMMLTGWFVFVTVGGVAGHIVQAIRRRRYAKRMPYSQAADMGVSKRQTIAQTAPCAIAYFCEDAGIQAQLQALRAEGFRIRNRGDGEDPSEENALMLVFLSSAFFQDESLVKALQRALKEKRSILPVYWSLQPNELPQSFAATLGQVQGLFPDVPEFGYFLRRSLKAGGCWRNLMEDYEFSVKGDEIWIDRYLGGSETAYVPRQAFEPPKRVTTVTGHTFTDGVGLREVYLTDAQHNIDIDAFYACRTLERIHVHPDNPVYYSEEGAFYRRDDDSLLVLPQGMSGAFSAAGKKIPSHIRSIDRADIQGKILSHILITPHRVFWEHHSLTSLILPSGLTKLVGTALRGCSALTSVTLPPDVRVIKGSAFDDCEALLSLRLPEGVRKIKKNTFSSCYALERLDIPAGVRSIGKDAFKYCPKLIMHTPKGSYAERYAQRYNLRCKAYSPEKWARHLGEED